MPKTIYDLLTDDEGLVSIEGFYVRMWVSSEREFALFLNDERANYWTCGLTTDNAVYVTHDEEKAVALFDLLEHADTRKDLWALRIMEENGFPIAQDG